MIKHPSTPITQSRIQCNRTWTLARAPAPRRSASWRSRRPRTSRTPPHRVRTRGAPRRRWPYDWHYGLSSASSRVYVFRTLTTTPTSPHPLDSPTSHSTHHHHARNARSIPTDSRGRRRGPAHRRRDAGDGQAQHGAHPQGGGPKSAGREEAGARAGGADGVCSSAVPPPPFSPWPGVGVLHPLG